MALPENFKDIDSNLSIKELKEFWKAYDAKEMSVVKGSISLHSESREWQMNWKGKTYTIHEWSELVDRVWREG